MKQCLTILLFFSVLLQSFSKVLIVAEYQANKDYIAKNICINRDKPKLGCAGKCHLKKQLAKDDQDTKDQGRQLEKQDVQLFLPAYVAEETVSIVAVASAEIFPALIQYLPSGYASGIFHPPSHIIG